MNFQIRRAWAGLQQPEQVEMRHSFLAELTITPRVATTRVEQSVGKGARRPVRTTTDKACCALLYIYIYIYILPRVISLRWFSKVTQNTAKGYCSNNRPYSLEHMLILYTVHSKSNMCSHLLFKIFAGLQKPGIAP